jgi:hypothetical protein
LSVFPNSLHSTFSMRFILRILFLVDSEEATLYLFQFYGDQFLSFWLD